MSGLHIDFSITQRTGLLKGFFTSTGIKEILEGNEYCTVDVVFSFLAGFLDRSLGCSDKPFLTPIHTLCSKNVNLLHFGTCGLNAPDQLDSSLQEMIVDLKWKANELFWNLEDVILFSRNSHILDHTVQGVARYLDNSFFDVSALGHINSIV